MNDSNPETNLVDPLYCSHGKTCSRLCGCGPCPDCDAYDSGSRTRFSNPETISDAPPSSYAKAWLEERGLHELPDDGLRTQYQHWLVTLTEAFSDAMDNERRKTELLTNHSHSLAASKFDAGEIAALHFNRLSKSDVNSLALLLQQVYDTGRAEDELLRVEQGVALKEAVDIIQRIRSIIILM